MLFLKQSTAGQSIVLGPFVDSTDGDTAETGLTIANTDILLSKNGGTLTAKNSGGGTHDADGWYAATFDATDTGTVGRLQIKVHVAGALPVYHEAIVLPANIYDSFIGGTDTLNAAVTEWNGVALSTTNPLPNAAADAAGGLVISDAGGLDIDSKLATATSALATSAALATVDGIVDTIATDTGTTIPGLIGTPSVDLASDISSISDVTSQFVFTVANQVDSNALSGGGGLDAAGVRSAIGLASANLDTQLGDILIDTAEIGAAGAGLTAIPWNAAWDAEVQSECDDALAAFTCDTGIGLAKLGEIVAALAAGKVSEISAAGVTTLTYKKRDGSTTSFTTVVTEADNTRATTGALS